MSIEWDCSLQGGMAMAALTRAPVERPSKLGDSCPAAIAAVQVSTVKPRRRDTICITDQIQLH